MQDTIMQLFYGTQESEKYPIPKTPQYREAAERKKRRKRPFTKSFPRSLSRTMKT